MMQSIKDLKGYVLRATDGEIGRCKDFLFDDRHWTIRYMVADTHKWLPGRKVLISPISLDQADMKHESILVKLNREEIKAAPPLEADEPVSRQYEARWFDHYGWSYYWGGHRIWGPFALPGQLAGKWPEKDAAETAPPEESHLRSADEVAGYHIQATDGKIGHVEDYLVDDESWVLRYIIVDTRNWLPGRKVLVSPEWANAVDWPHKKVFVNLTREKIKNSPEYKPAEPVNREYESMLFRHYDLPPYWRRP
jgi:hypothetical protein